MFLPNYIGKILDVFEPAQVYSKFGIRDIIPGETVTGIFSILRAYKSSRGTFIKYSNTTTLGYGSSWVLFTASKMTVSDLPPPGEPSPPPTHYYGPRRGDAAGTPGYYVSTATEIPDPLPIDTDETAIYGTGHSAAEARADFDEQVETVNERHQIMLNWMMLNPGLAFPGFVPGTNDIMEGGDIEMMPYLIVGGIVAGFLLLKK